MKLYRWQQYIPNGKNKVIRAICVMGRYVEQYLLDRPNDLLGQVVEVDLNEVFAFYYMYDREQYIVKSTPDGINLIDTKLVNCGWQLISGAMVNLI